MIPKSPTGRTLKQDRARRKRLKAAEYAHVCRLVDIRDGGLCRSCQRKAGVHHHHLAYRSRGGEDTTQNLVLLCEICHRAIHDGKLQLMTTNKGGDGRVLPFWQWSGKVEELLQSAVQKAQGGAW